jgi:carbon-monoxide dehydrogenase medium subunit
MVIARDFEYARPTTMAEAVQLLGAHPGDARVLNGGTDLIAWLRDDAVAPDLLVDIKTISGLDEITIEGSTLSIGSQVTFTQLIESALISEQAPLLMEMSETVASPGIRNRATVVGNICSAVPSCDAGPVLLAYDTTVHLQGPRGPRSIPIDEWFVGVRATAKSDDEIVSHLTIEVPDHAGCYTKLMRYGGEDLAQAAVAIVATSQHEYRVAFGAVAPTPIRARSIDAVLSGAPIDDERIMRAKALVSSEISPISDMRASAEYRAHICEVMLDRGLRATASRLGGSGPPYGTRLI